MFGYNFFISLTLLNCERVRIRRTFPGFIKFSGSTDYQLCIKYIPRQHDLERDGMGGSSDSRSIALMSSRTDIHPLIDTWSNRCLLDSIDLHPTWRGRLVPSQPPPWGYRACSSTCTLGGSRPFFSASFTTLQSTDRSRHSSLRSTRGVFRPETERPIGLKQNGLPAACKTHQSV